MIGINDMNKPILCACTRHITARISEQQFLHIKSQVKPSAFIRGLIERDIRVVQDEKL